MRFALDRNYRCIELDIWTRPSPVPQAWQPEPSGERMSTVRVLHAYSLQKVALLRKLSDDTSPIAMTNEVDLSLFIKEIIDWRAHSIRRPRAEL